MLTINDVAIIGAGPAGLQAAISAASELQSVVVIDGSNKTGGAAGTSSHIENIAGYDESGAVITGRMTKSAQKHGAKFILGKNVTRISTEGNIKALEMSDGSFILAKAVVVATGLKFKMLDIPGADTYFGREIQTGSVLSRVRACKGLPITIVGAANSAGQLAMYASEFASFVTMLMRGENLEDGMSDYLVKRIAANPKIEVINHAEVAGAAGDKHLKTVTYKRFDQTVETPSCALFICIGAKPKTEWLPEELTRDAQGFLVADGKRRHETKIEGLFVIGDVNSQSVKRVGGAIGQGTEVVPSIHDYLSQTTFSLQ